MSKKRFALLAFFVFLALLVTVVFGSRLRDYGDFSVIEPGDGIEYEFVSVNGSQLHVATAGPKDGEPVILLHGYPDAHFGWRDQIVALADASFRVIAPDQRGYNLSDKPKGVENYMMDILVSDILALADHYGLKTFNLAGHDFGGIVSWYRALFKQSEQDKPNSLIDVPTLVVWGKRDPHIMWQSAEPSAAMTTSGQVVYIDDATHWVLRDAPEKTGELLVDFFNRSEK